MVNTDLITDSSEDRVKLLVTGVSQGPAVVVVAHHCPVQVVSTWEQLQCMVTRDPHVDGSWVSPPGGAVNPGPSTLGCLARSGSEKGLKIYVLCSCKTF